MHEKHPTISRPDIGHFNRNEFAFLGAPCGLIQTLQQNLIASLGSQLRIGIVDADHGDGEDHSAQAKPDRVYTDKITSHRLDFHGDWSVHQYRMWFNDQDVVLVNGNHFQSARQIVIIDSRKRESLERKLDRLTDVCLFLLGDGQEDIWPFLREHIPHADQIPVLRLSDTHSVAEWLGSHIQKPPLKGLVLAGGKSTRMGRDKGELNFYGKPQREYMADLLAPHCREVFLSVRSGQQVPSSHQLIEDSFIGLGPFGALLSAFRNDPDAAWLVVACDLPLLNADTLRQLINGRNPSKVATSFRSPVNGFPEPLVAIWEPKAYLHALAFMAQGYSCPRKVLINTDICLLEAADASALTNVNTPEDLAALQGKDGK